MLTIRQPQIEALSRERVADFERRMLEHLRRHFPSHLQALGDANALLLVRHALSTGQPLCVVSERDVCKLAGLMVAFGPDLFERHAWAQQAWQAEAATPDERVARLYDAALGEVRRGLR